MTRLGYFLKVLVTIFPTNVAQILGNIMAYLKMLFLGKTDVMTIWATLGKIGLLSILSSGHTGRHTYNEMRTFAVIDVPSAVAGQLLIKIIKINLR